jgi:GDP-4-dehydro-6-deoxy-D-mannose reductase
MPDPATAGAVIVTGAGGFVGRHVISALRQHGRPVTAWTHRAAPGDHVRVVDVMDPLAIAAALQASRPVALIHLAGAPHVGQSWQDSAHPLRVNALGTHHVLNGLRLHAPACRALVVTSAMVYAPSAESLTEEHPLGATSPYGVSKLAQDELARRAGSDDGLAVVVARPFNHTGPGQSDSFALSSFCRQIVAAERGTGPARLRVGNLDAKRDLTDVRDVVAAYITLLDLAAPGSVWNVCTGNAHRIGDLLEYLLAQARIPITVEQDPARMRPADQPCLQGDPSRLQQAFGWRPTFTIEDTLTDMLEWWRSQP